MIQVIHYFHQLSLLNISPQLLHLLFLQVFILQFIGLSSNFHRLYYQQVNILLINDRFCLIRDHHINLNFFLSFYWYIHPFKSWPNKPSIWFRNFSSFYLHVSRYITQFKSCTRILISPMDVGWIYELIFIRNHRFHHNQL